MCIFHWAARSLWFVLLVCARQDTGMMDTFFITDKDNVTMPPTPDYASNCAPDITQLLSDPLDVSDYYIAASKVHLLPPLTACLAPLPEPLT